MNSYLCRAALAGLVSLVVTAPASAAVSLTFVETGSGVVGSFSGSLDLAGLSGPTGPAISGSGASIAPSLGVFHFRSLGGADVYTGIFSLTAFGSGFSTTTFTNSGDYFELVAPPATPNRQLFVPRGYVSGAQLSGSATYAGATLASLGIGPGPFTTTLPSGDTINIFASPVPEAGTLGLMAAGLGLLGLVARRRRGQVVTTQA